jgi:hypothetical protein
VAGDDAVDRLYGLPLEAFVAERDALAKELRADGRREEANGVKALRRPTVAAWAVNQAVRTQRPAAEELWAAGDELIAAQGALLEGRGDARALRAAADRETAALDALVDAARGLLTGSGRDLGEATIERVRETLHAAAVESEAREEVAAGRATRERAHAGLGGFEAAAEVPAPPRPSSAPERGVGREPGRPALGGRARRGRRAAPAAEPERAADRRADAARERAERQAAEREEAERRRAAARQVAEAERGLRAADDAVAKAQRAAERAAERLEAARAAAAEANAALDAAGERRREAAAALDRARAERRDG